MSKKKRKFKNMLLMPKIQLKYIYYVLSLIIAPFLFLLTYAVVQFNKLGLEMQLLQVNENIIIHIDQTVRSLSVAGVLVLLYLTFSSILGVLLVSHRFVGPMYVINKYIEAMINGDYIWMRGLRDQDEMKETMELLKKLGEQLDKKLKSR